MLQYILPGNWDPTLVTDLDSVHMWSIPKQVRPKQ